MADEKTNIEAQIKLLKEKTIKAIKDAHGSALGSTYGILCEANDAVTTATAAADEAERDYLEQKIAIKNAEKDDIKDIDSIIKTIVIELKKGH